MHRGLEERCFWYAIEGSEKCSLALLVLGTLMTLGVLAWQSGRKEAVSGIIV